MKNSDECQQKYTDIFSIDLIVLEELIGLMDKSSFMATLAFLIHLYKSHFL